MRRERIGPGAEAAENLQTSKPTSLLSEPPTIDQAQGLLLNLLSRGTQALPESARAGAFRALRSKRPPRSSQMSIWRNSESCAGLIDIRSSIGTMSFAPGSNVDKSTTSSLCTRPPPTFSAGGGTGMRGRRRFAFPPLPEEPPPGRMKSSNWGVRSNQPAFLDRPEKARKCSWRRQLPPAGASFGPAVAEAPFPVATMLLRYSGEPKIRGSDVRFDLGQSSREESLL
mmetsp:Transcript_76738/g.167671  ORF Transcript_76738/g.167671 Transcript_76738/m.167671 type:complete len:227 (-) Transcript_76738:87-767(-)